MGTHWDRLFPSQQLTGLTHDHPLSRVILKLGQKSRRLSRAHSTSPVFGSGMFKGRLHLAAATAPPEAVPQKRLSGSRHQMSTRLTYKVHRDEFPSSGGCPTGV